MLSRISRRRRGFANLEYVLSLPLVMLLLGAIVSGAYVVMNRVIVSQSVRRDAWAKREETPPGGTVPGLSPSMIGVLPGVAPSQGMVSVETTRTIILPAYIHDRVVHGKAEHHVMAGAWDFRTLPFPARPALQPEPRMSVYSPGAAPAVGSMTAAFQLLGLPF